MIWPPQFTETEFACKCGCGRCDMDQNFINKLGAVRNLFGEAMIITSGFRCNNYNMKLPGAAKDSQHLKGKAADIACADASKRYRLIALAIQCGMNGIGIDGAFIHMDSGDRPIKLIFVYPLHG